MGGPLGVGMQDQPKDLASSSAPPSPWRRFWTRKDKPWPWIREAAVILLGIVLLVTLLYGLTAQPLVGGYPVVVVTSGSMMHCTNANERHDTGSTCNTETFAGVGTIDPGDLVFVRHVGERGDVETLGAQGGSSYGKPGDVVVYRAWGSTASTPIIHRALFWLQINGDGTYDVPDLGISHARTLDSSAIKALIGNCSITTSGPHGAFGPADSGFITRGDNNPGADQCTGLSGPVRLEWILGKARGELPWVGLVKLFVDGFTGKPDFNNASGTAKVMMVVVLVVILGTPWAVERVRQRRRRGPDDPEPPQGDGP